MLGPGHTPLTQAARLRERSTTDEFVDRGSSESHSGEHLRQAQEAERADVEVHRCTVGAMGARASRTTRKVPRWMGNPPRMRSTVFRDIPSNAHVFASPSRASRALTAATVAAGGVTRPD